MLDIFLSFVFDLLNQPYSKFLYQLYFIRLMIFEYFKRVSNFRFLMPVSLVQWRGEIGVFYDKFQVFLNSSTCFSVAAPPYVFICHNFRFTKLLTLISITFFLEFCFLIIKKLMAMSSWLNHTLEVLHIFLLHGVCLNICGMLLGLLYSVLILVQKILSQAKVLRFVIGT